jgi:molecular chaperone DnaJ
MHDFQGMGVDDIFSIFGDIFGGAFGGRSRGRGRGHGDHGVDIQTVIEVDLREVATGVEKTLRFERLDFCETCAGKGAEPGSKVIACGTCGGYGQVEQQANLGFIVTRTVVDCPSCKGRGSVIEQPCAACRGSGRTRKECVLNVQIPAGIHDGQRIRMRGEGEPGPSGTTRGDLHCVAQVRAHPFFVRDGDHLVCRLPISFTQASLGAQVDVPTLGGKTPLRIPPGTQYGAVFRLPGKGLPNLRSGRMGDEVVQVLIEIPGKLTTHQQELLRQFAASEDKEVMPESRGFFDRVKEYFTGHPDQQDS